MSNYLRSTLFETEFDGDSVKIRLRPIKEGDFRRIRSLRKPITAAITPEEKTAAVEAFTDTAKEAFAEILPAYMESLEGLTSADGSPITVAEFVRDAYFSDLLLRTGLALVKSGSIKDPKAAASPPGVTSAG